MPFKQESTGKKMAISPASTMWQLT